MELLTKKEAAAEAKCHPEHLMKLARAGHFPAPIKMGPEKGSAVRFVKSEVEHWLAARMAARVYVSAPGGIPALRE